MAKTFIFHGFDGIYTSIFSIFSSKYIQLALLEVPILCSKRNRSVSWRNGAAREEPAACQRTETSFPWCFFGLPSKGTRKHTVDGRNPAPVDR